MLYCLWYLWRYNGEGYTVYNICTHKAEANDECYTVCNKVNDKHTMPNTNMKATTQLGNAWWGYLYIIHVYMYVHREANNEWMMNTTTHSWEMFGEGRSSPSFPMVEQSFSFSGKHSSYLDQKETLQIL